MRATLVKILAYLVPLTGLIAVANCGGGGGDDGDFIGAAQASVTASPSSIDTGDLTQIRTDLSRVHENGIVLKYRFPTGLGLVPNSALLRTGGDELELSPSIKVESGNFRFLVFFLPFDLFGSDHEGHLSFELEGLSSVEDGKLEVDADVDDPLIDNSVEFDVNAPEFGAEDSVSIEVKD